MSPTEHMPYNPAAYAKHPSPPPHVPPEKGALAAHWATWLLNTQRGRLTYSEGPSRSELFHKAPGVAMPAGVGADCSQFVSACLHWAGVTTVNDTDYTGTLLQKGHLIAPTFCKPGDIVIYGPGTGEHTDMLVAPAGVDWWVEGFGHQGGPDHGLLSGSAAWFNANGHPGLRFLRFA